MNWEIIKETKRKYADESYYLKAKKECFEGMITLEISFIERFMYDLSVKLHRKKPQQRFLFFKDTKPDLLYNCLIFYNGRIEKYGHQIMRITEELPIEKLNRLNSFQKDGVLNWNLGKKFNTEFTTNLPKKP